MRAWRALGVAVVAAIAATLPASSAMPTPAPDHRGALRVEVISKRPHDPQAFTQGLELHDGVLYESTGLYGSSDVRTVDPETGEVLRRVPLPDTAFGEGLTLVGSEIWQLTWQEGYAFRRDATTLAALEQVPHPGEGWGICYDTYADHLVMSDGSAELTFRDPDTFDPLGTVTVRRDGQPLTYLNELECVGGSVWANIWQTDEIVRIDPISGEVTAVVDASGLLAASEAASSDVLNGIAAVPGSDTFLITGKLWPWLFEVRFVPAH